MSDFIYSNAFNFSTYVNGRVDLRTGQYGMTIHLTTLRSQFNPHLSRDISLSFSMMNTTDTGFGTGWSLHNSEYLMWHPNFGHRHRGDILTSTTQQVT